MLSGLVRSTGLLVVGLNPVSVPAHLYAPSAQVPDVFAKTPSDESEAVMIQINWQVHRYELTLTNPPS
jgi:hypothetical protein